MGQTLTKALLCHCLFNLITPDSREKSLQRSLQPNTGKAGASAHTQANGGEPEDQ